MNNMDEESQFTSLHMNDDNNIKSGGLDFLPTNYDYDMNKSQESYTKTSDTDSVLNFGNIGKF